MLKRIAALFAVAIVCGLTGCGSNDLRSSGRFHEQIDSFNGAAIVNDIVSSADGTVPPPRVAGSIRLVSDDQEGSRSAPPPSRGDHNGSNGSSQVASSSHQPSSSAEKPKDGESSGNGNGGGSGENNQDGTIRREARYSEATVFPSISAGYYHQSKAEDGLWISPELYLQPGHMWYDTGLPGMLRLNMRASYMEVQGRFDTGPTSHTDFNQDRLRLGVGPNLVLGTENLSHMLEINVLAQEQFAGHERRDDGLKTDGGASFIPELRLTYGNTVLPRLFQPDQNAYTALEGVSTWDTSSGVVWVRGTLKHEVAAFGSTSGQTLGQFLLDVPAPANRPRLSVVSLRFGPRVEAMGGGHLPEWQMWAGGYGEIYFPKLLLSIDGFVGHDLPGMRGPGLVHSAGIWFGFEF